MTKNFSMDNVRDVHDKYKLCSIIKAGTNHHLHHHHHVLMFGLEASNVGTWQMRGLVRAETQMASLLESFS